MFLTQLTSKLSDSNNMALLLLIDINDCKDRLIRTFPIPNILAAQSISNPVRDLPYMTETCTTRG